MTYEQKGSLIAIQAITRQMRELQEKLDKHVLILKETV